MVGVLFLLIAVVSVLGLLWVLRAFKRRSPGCIKSNPTGYPNPPAPIPLSLQVNENQYFRENNVRARNRADLILEPEQLIAPSLPGASTSVLSLKPYYNEPPPPYSLMENTSNERTINSNSPNIHNQLPVYDQLPGAMGAPINYFPYVQDPNCVLPQKR